MKKTNTSLSIFGIGVLLITFGLNAQNGTDSSYLTVDSNTDSTPGVIKVVCDRAFPPYEYINSDGEPAGFDVDVFEGAMKAVGLKYEIDMHNFFRCRKLLDDGKADLMLGLGSMPTMTEGKCYSNGIGSVNVRIVTKSGSVINDIKELNGMEVIMPEGRNLFNKLKNEGVITIPKYVDNMQDGLTLLARGKYKVALCDQAVAMYFIEKNKLYNLEVHSPSIFTVELRFATLSRNRKLMAKVDQGLAILHSTGKYDRLYKKWFGGMPYTTPFMSTTGYVISGSVVIILLIAALMAIIYKKRLHKATASLIDTNRQLSLVIDAAALTVWEYNIQENKILIRNRDNNGVTIKDSDEIKDKIFSDDVSIATETLQKLLSGDKEVTSCCIRMYYSNLNEYRYIESDMTVIKNKAGTIIKIIGTSRDVTTQQVTIENQEDMIRSLDLAMCAGNIYAWNYNKKFDKYCILYGKTQNNDGNVIATPASLNIIPEDRNKCKEYIQLCLSQNSDSSPIVVRGEKSGDSGYRYFQISSKPTFDENGEIIGLIGVNKEITDIYDLQIKIKERATLIEAIYATISAGILFYNEKGELQEMNGAALKMYDFPSRDVMTAKKNLFESMTHHKCSIEHLKKGGKIQYIGPILQGREGCIYDTYIVSVMSDDNNILGYLQVNNDITQLMNEKAEAERLKIVYETMFNSIFAGAEIRDEEDRIVSVNRKFGEIFGLYNVDSYLNNHNKIEDIKLIPQEVKNAVKSKQTSEFVLPINFDEMKTKYNLSTTKDGIMYCLIKASPMINIDNKEVGTVLLYSDITVKVNSEKALADERSKTELAIKGSEIILWEYDCLTQHIMVNTGDSSSDTKTILSDDFFQLVQKDDKGKVLQFLNMMHASYLDKFLIDVKFMSKEDRQWHYCTIAAQPFKFQSDGKCILYAGYCRDNTRLVMLNKEIREYAERLDFILGHSQVFTWDYSPTSRIIILRVSKPDKREEQIEANEVFFNLFHKEDRDQAREIFRNMDLFKTKDFKATLKVMRDGAKKYVEFNGVGIKDENGQLVKYSGLCKDVTEMMEVQHKLEEEKQKAQQSDKLKSAFLANMSHEIRTPLNAIVGFSELLQDTTDDSEKKEYINIINTNNALLLKIIGDILDLSKIEAGVMEFYPETFDFPPFFENLCSSLEKRILNIDVKFIKNNPEPRLILHIDKTRLSQVIINLVNNAIKYTSKGFIRIGYEVEDEGVYFYVSDSGIGIDSADIPRLFSRFEKLGSFVQGTGLGLAISKAVISALGGEMGCESKKGLGSTFWFKLPKKYIL